MSLSEEQVFHGTFQKVAKNLSNSKILIHMFGINTAVNISL